MSENEDILHEEVLKQMLRLQQRYFVVKTKFTENHIERTTYRDRGRWKWISETTTDAYDAMKHDEEAKRSHVDGGDLFPRLYFNDSCFLMEFLTWVKVRGLKITEITVPKI